MNKITNISQNSIWIYVTDIKTTTQMERAAKTLNAERFILRWSVDTEDVDHVLRVESKVLGEYQIQRTLEKQGFMCAPMLD